MSTTTLPPGTGTGADDGGDGRRHGPGRALVVLGALLAAVLVAGAALAVLGVLLRHETTARASYDGVDAVRLDARCPGDVGVAADPALEPGAAEVVWRERWSLRRPTHGARVRSGSLELGTACPGAAVGGSSTSRVEVRVAPGTPAAAASSAGDVVVRGTGADVRASAGTGDVRVDGAGAGVVVGSGAGDVEVSGALVTVRVRGGAGDVDVVSTTAPDLVDVTNGAGDVDVHLPVTGGGYDVDADAGVGGSEVTVARDPASPHRVRVSTGAGDVEVEPAP